MTEAAATEPSTTLDRPMSLLGDERLARRAAGGDRRAFAAIYRRYQEDLYRFCLAIVGNSQDAQDALQSTMVQALRALPGEKREIKLKPWLYRVARNEAIDLIRRRRESPELDPEQIVSGEEIAGSVETRDRLRGLLADLGELPERQRAALVMRELAGFEFAEIGAAFETSAAVARQTVYEARIGLRQMESGREMSCEEAKREISRSDGRGLRRRDIRAHLRGCEDCRRFRDGIAERRRDFVALAPLPAVAATGLLQAVLGGSGGTGGGALAGAGTAGTIAGKALATSAMAKSVAAVALVAAGVAAADRSGLIETPIPGGHQASSAAPARAVESSRSSSHPAADVGAPASGVPHGSRSAAGGWPSAGGRAGSAANGGGAGDGTSGGSGTAGHEPGGPGELPSASSHGQSTAPSHGGGRSNAHSYGAGHSHRGGGHSHAHGQGHPHESATGPSHEGHPSHPVNGGPATPSHPSHPAPSPNPQPEVGPDKEPGAPLQPPKPHSNQGAAEGERPTS
jgi:RNA polymerase sigma factor (sigma-70 family)